MEWNETKQKHEFKLQKPYMQKESHSDSKQDFFFY